jgi:hypothetical protein
MTISRCELNELAYHCPLLWSCSNVLSICISSLSKEGDLAVASEDLGEIKALPIRRFVLFSDGAGDSIRTCDRHNGAIK